MRYWYYGDGSSSWIAYKNKEHAYSSITFCTNDFTKAECDFLAAIGVSITPYMSESGWMLKTNKWESAHNLFNYMGEPELECFAYKWKRPDPLIRVPADGRS